MRREHIKDGWWEMPGDDANLLVKKDRCQGRNRMKSFDHLERSAS
jgi:hypothetical protein